VRASSGIRKRAGAQDGAAIELPGDQLQNYATFPIAVENLPSVVRAAEIARHRDRVVVDHAGAERGEHAVREYPGRPEAQRQSLRPGPIGRRQGRRIDVFHDRDRHAEPFERRPRHFAAERQLFLDMPGGQDHGHAQAARQRGARGVQHNAAAADQDQGGRPADQNHRGVRSKSPSIG
jgi:hypothetical protein